MKKYVLISITCIIIPALCIVNEEFDSLTRVGFNAHHEMGFLSV